jgi:hypothetical protein
MGGGKRRRQEEERIAKAVAARISPAKPRILSRVFGFWATAVSLAAAVAGLAGVYFLGPSITVGGAETLRSMDPLAVPFIAKNDGFLPAQNVAFSCRIVKARLSVGEIEGNTFRQPALDVPTLARGRSVTVPCLLRAVIGGAPLHSAEVEITVIHHGFYGLWADERRFLFEAYRADNGQFRFSPKAN